MRSWLLRRWCTRQQLDFFIGHLYHAAMVVWSGKTFLCLMIDLLCCFHEKDHPIWLNKEFLLDLQWWNHLLAQCHCVSFWLHKGCFQQWTLRCCLMLMVCWALVLTSWAIGLSASGMNLKCASLLHTRSYSPLQLQLTCGGRGGENGMCYFTQTTM